VSLDRRRFLIRPVLAVLTMTLLVGGGASVASATFRSSTGGSTSIRTDVVPPPTALTATACSGGSSKLTWTPSTWSRPVSGYELHLTTGAVTTKMAVPGDRTAKTATISNLRSGAKYTFAVSSLTPGKWTSVDSNTVTVQC
jgi:Fibronectin type III domain